jgi:hypothetical protein
MTRTRILTTALLLALAPGLGLPRAQAQGCPGCAAAAVAPGPAVLAPCPACGEGPSCGPLAPNRNPCCGQRWCCQQWHFCVERPPCLKFHCVCSRPVCDPCELPHYGYYPVCWRPMGPFDYNHCPTPAPAVMAVPLVPDPPQLAPPASVPPEPPPPPPRPRVMAPPELLRGEAH